jgi:hypothetical protein
MKLLAVVLLLPLSGCCGALCYFSKAIDGSQPKLCETKPPGAVCSENQSAEHCWECRNGIWARYHRRVPKGEK